ncbi:MAG: cyclic nucleotide-binding domain-containing protein [Dehalococcoidia bacterium]|nr:cyclic nucleotide-binding domain-containing protein [Dehalococcoidia bacterium]
MTIAALRRTALFQGLPLTAIGRLASLGRTRRFRAGRVLMKQGDAARVMFVIVKGAVRVERSHRDLTGPVLLSVLGRGEVVGEMGLLDGEPRSATVTAEVNVTAVELAAAQLAQAMAESVDVATALLHIMSRRIRDTDELLAQALTGRWAPPVKGPE